MWTWLLPLVGVFAAFLTGLGQVFSAWASGGGGG